MPRHLRIAVSVFFGLLTVALCVLWVRSYWSNELVSRVSPTGRLVTLGINRGCAYSATMKHKLTQPNVVYPSIGLTTGSPYRIQLQKLGQSQAYTWPSTGLIWRSHGWRYHLGDVAKSGPPFQFMLRQNMAILQLPIGLLVLLSVAVGCSPWCKVRFSLRTLLIAATLLAVVLGLSVWLPR